MGQGQFIYFCQGGSVGGGGFKTNLNKKEAAQGNFFSVTSVRITFFLKWEGKTGRGDDPGQLTKFRQGVVDTWGVLPIFFLKFFFSI